MMKKYIPLFIFIGFGLQGCNDAAEEKAPANPNGTISDATKSEEGQFLVIKQTAKDPDSYIIEEKHPSSTGTRAILKDMEGNERMLTEEELKKLAEAEAAKVDNGTSNLTQTPEASSPGLSLGETILAGAAAGLIGGLIASKLAGNSNYQQHQQVQQQQTSAYQQRQATSRKSFTRGTSTTPASKSSSGSIYGNTQSTPSRKSKKRGKR
jgi:hypothetical protein